jgi:hypothetical protein
MPADSVFWVIREHCRQWYRFVVLNTDKPEEGTAVSIPLDFEQAAGLRDALNEIARGHGGG